MGTRHLTAVYVDGECKVAQHGQWDGHPYGAGKTVLEFMRACPLPAFADKCRAAHWVDKDELARLWESYGANDSGMIEYSKAQKFESDHPQLGRDAGADVLQIILDSEDGIRLKNSISFAADSVFCEWAYVVDLGAGALEVYKGFNESPTTGERFSDVERGDDSEYFPVRLVRKYALDDLPSAERFLKECDGE